jgi:hypothetical protein
MKKLLLVLLIFVSTQMYSQDGLCGFIDNDSTDIFISTFNSDSFNRDEICMYMYELIVDDKCRQRTYALLLDNGTTIIGDIVISEVINYILYDFYVDRIIYSNGLVYENKRFIKPQTNKNKY